MDQHRITVLRHSLIGMPSRRDILRGLTGVGLGLGFSRLPEPSAAKRKRKNKKKRSQPNAFGCLSVGAICKNADQCCSGICEGKKGKRKCRAHDTGSCQQDAQAVCQTGTPT